MLIIIPIINFVKIILLKIIKFQEVFIITLEKIIVRE